MNDAVMVSDVHLGQLHSGVIIYTNGFWLLFAVMFINVVMFIIKLFSSRGCIIVFVYFVETSLGGPVIRPLALVPNGMGSYPWLPKHI